MFALWALTIFDWVKTVIEEQVYREAEMSRTKLIRLSGWGLMLGPVLLFIGLGEPAQYRNLLNNLFGALDDQSGVNALQFVSESALIILMITGLGFMFFGFWGLYTNYHKQVRKLGGLSLRLLVIGSGVSVLGVSLSFARTDLWWFIFIAGFLSTYVSFTIFGIVALKDKPLPRWNALPFLTGIWLPGMLVIGGVLGWDENQSFTIMTVLFALLGLILTGYLLQLDTEKPAITG